ncbi:MAG: glycosyltransferase family 4 protein [Endomicrobia bacterium]|nr:glycosyltransferase family 4 protein [Endomicrobiia bacterium]
MKVVQWNSAKCLGGAELRVIELTEGLIKKGHNICVVCVKDTFLEQQLKLHNITTICYKDNILGYLELFFKLRKFLPDILHIHTGKDYFLGIIFGILIKAKVVIHRRILSEVSFLTSLLIKLTKTKIIANSKVVKEVLVNKNKFFSKDIEVIYNSIPKSRLEVDVKKLEELKKIYKNKNNKIILSVGNFYLTKGFRDLVEIIRILDQKLKNFLVLIIGDGPDRLKIEELIKKYKLETKIKILGQRIDVIEFFHLADCFVLFSYEEAFGVVFLEAIGCGKPVVGYDSCGVAEIVGNRDIGFVVPLRDFNLAAEKIFILLTNFELNMKYSKNAKEYFNKKFNYDIMIEKIENIYSNLLGGNDGNKEKGYS